MFVLYSARTNVYGYEYVSINCSLFFIFCFSRKMLFESLTLLSPRLFQKERNMVRSFVRRTVLLAAVAVTICAGTGERRSAAANKRQAPTEGDYADRSSDGSYAFRYADRNQFHTAVANKDNIVSGRYSVCYVTRSYECTTMVLLVWSSALCDRYGQRSSGRYSSSP